MPREVFPSLPLGAPAATKPDCLWATLTGPSATGDGRRLVARNLKQ